MAFVAALCPQCAGALQVPDDRDVVRCMYCAVEVVVRQAIQLVPGNSKNLLALANSAAESGNYKEAYEYFNKVLEANPRHPEAWLGKGTAAGWQSTLADFRFSEMSVAFENAIKYSADDDRQNIQSACVKQLSAVGLACFKLAKQHVVEFPDLDNNWNKYLERCHQIMALYELALAYAPANQTILENLVYLCKDNIEGLVFDNPRAKGSVSLQPKYEAQLRTKLLTYASVLKQLDAGYVTPEPQKPSNCFVITATMGNESHPFVKSLRAFRDETLVHTAVGERFIAWYYAHGPAIAAQVAKSRVARKASLVLIVAPAVTLVHLYRTLRPIAARACRAVRTTGRA